MFKRKRFYSLILLMIIFLVYMFVKEFQDSKLEIVDYPQLEMPKKSDENLDVNLHSSNAILVNLDTKMILLDKGSDEMIYPASLTKIMTVLVAIENIPNLQEKILLPKSIFKDLYEENATMAGFLPNEEVTAEDLLYGTMLPSGADASIGLADYIAGSERKFVKLMNEKAKQLGMKNTHFKNTTGLHHPDHYTSVKDISILLQYALTNKTFRDIYTAEKYSIKSTNLHPEGMTVSSRMFKNLDANEKMRGEIIGGKTGYTEQAGLCLASLATINGEEYILVTVGAEGDSRTEQFNITDALAVYRQLN
ncbi:D-Ala-D-Ala carboxypeptidase [Lysinibacillus sphaericus]|uniref:D-alanyl-D-alanine carboxypeptidase family protein n=1 Tax=Lysinibacillus sphaericus TaxID=1421 RepID=UPI0018CFD97A|nr:D-alanyl-D-alanine carboxypeptidase [Lysinibacillus sphaericus]MBG9453209.1 D-Ala-D-Ala carboxypeptidase [Lysinibacillus sphaericus]MBG9476064.1 D-Ala-D-Ala carboxypeptidase [Lysinibacillus sphaericus]MBG9591912.1 D-Ala-D-Ala carboxypeptidase [Lysinibacillus sphaericus]